MFYIITKNLVQRNALIEYYKNKNIHAAFPRLSLLKSPFYNAKYERRELMQADRYADCLGRLNMFYELISVKVERICNEIKSFYES